MRGQAFRTQVIRLWDNVFGSDGCRGWLYSLSMRLSLGIQGLAANKKQDPRMTLKAFLVVFLMWASLAIAAEPTKFRAAHTKVRDTNMVFIVVGEKFFEVDQKTQQRWYTSLQSCVRNVTLAGEVVAVADVKGALKTYGPKSWGEFLSTIDVAWVDARINKELFCTF